MKLDKKTVFLLVIVFVVLAVVVSVPNTFDGKSEYKEHVAAARNYYKDNLCVLSIQEYDKAIYEEDSVELELELCDVYMRGFENGEIRSRYELEKFFSELVTNYHEEVIVYEKAMAFYQKEENYPAIVSLLEQADSNNITSDKLSAAREDVRYRYETLYSVIVEFERSLEGNYTVLDSDNYYVYNDKFGAVFSNRFDYASVYINGYLVAKENEYTFIMNSDGVRIAYLDNAIDFSTGFGNDLIACRKNDVFSYYNISGEKVFGDYVFAGRFRENYAAVQTNKGWCLIDTNGNVVGDKYFDEIKLGSSYECVTGGVFFAKKEGKYALYNTKMERLTENKFDDCDIFVSKDGYAAVAVGGKWGYINIAGKDVIKPMYESANSFSNGLAAVISGEECFFINSSGKKVVVGDFKDGDYFNASGFCLVKNETYWYPIQRYYTLNY